MTRSDDDSEPLVVRDAAALIIGTELLSGKIRDENLHALSNTLRAIGVDLRRAVFCPDDRDTIARDVAALRQTHDVVFTSGGVGPTHDDVTVEGISQALGVEIVLSPELEAILRSVYGDETNETHLQMARVPRGATLAEAAGVRWPTVVAENVWILPGVPELFRMKLAVVRTKLRGPMPFFTEQIFCSVEETELKMELDRIVEENPDVDVGSYPKWFDKRYKTRLTFDARSRDLAQQAARLARDLLGDSVVPVD